MLLRRSGGRDLLGLTEDGRYTGLELMIRLKSDQESREMDGNERQTSNVSTYNYLWNKLAVPMVVNYVESENEAYYILLKDVPEPNQNASSFTIYIPRENKLSALDWTDVKDYVREVTDRKLAAQRVREKL